MNRKFKAPPIADLEQWAKVRFLSDHGFRFGSIVDAEGQGVPYPGTLRDARKFVREHVGEASARLLTQDGPPKGKRRRSQSLPLTKSPRSKGRPT